MNTDDHIDNLCASYNIPREDWDKLYEVFQRIARNMCEAVQAIMDKLLPIIREMRESLKDLFDEYQEAVYKESSKPEWERQSRKNRLTTNYNTNLHTNRIYTANRAYYRTSYDRICRKRAKR